MVSGPTTSPATIHDNANWRPVDESQRYTALDLLRGFALIGVLLVNLLSFFRVSLFAHIRHLHMEAGWANHAVDLFVAEFVEFKAITLFSFVFGIGAAIQFERAALRGTLIELFLLRRFLILFLVGACHMVFVSNVDILCLYATCGLLLIPLLRLPSAILAAGGLAAIYLRSIYSIRLPPGPVMAAHAVVATRVYSHGGFGEILAFRWLETQQFIAPLLIGSAQTTLGLMLLGVAVWRAGIIRSPERHRRLLWSILLAGGAIGLANTTVNVWSQASGNSLELPSWLDALGSQVPLALSYASGLLLWRRPGHDAAWPAPVAAAGRMALSNYLAQSVIFSLIFNSYGLGLFGRMAAAPAAALGIAVYLGQLWFSVWWLHRYRFGPFEWLWRSLTYGRLQSMRR